VFVGPTAGDGVSFVAGGDCFDVCYYFVHALAGGGRREAKRLAGVAIGERQRLGPDAGGEALFSTELTVNQKKPAQDAVLVVSVRRVVGKDVSPALTEQRIPVAVF